jgi:hypothetical protein
MAPGTALTRTIALTAAVGVSACGSTKEHDSKTLAQPVNAVTPSGKHLGRISTPGTPRGEQTVRIKVVASSSKPDREALAIVPVYINGKGPLPFAVDTGASKTLIAGAAAKKLHLQDLGSGGVLSGIAGSAPSERVKVVAWRIGSVGLPSQVISAMSSSAAAGKAQPGPAPQPKQKAGPEIVGLLGSDVLSRFGKFAIDYDHELLILDPKVK